MDSFIDERDYKLLESDKYTKIGSARCSPLIYY